MSSNAFKRQLWLLNTLLRHKRLTFEEIRRLWEYASINDERKSLSLRTFHNHKDALCSMFGISIACSAADGYKYSISNEAPLDNAPYLQWLVNTFNTVETIRQSADLHERIILEEMSDGAQFLQTVIRAMRECRVLNVKYQSYYKTEPRELHFRPYCIKVLRQRWYVVGMVEEDRDIKTISLDRAWNMEATDKHFEYPKDFSPKEYFRNSVGIYVNEGLKPENIVVRVHGVMAAHLRSVPLHESQEELQSTSNSTDFRYRMAPSHELVLRLLGMGRSAEVIEPEILKDMVRDELRNMLKAYQQESTSEKSDD